jgi:tRNA (guanine-N7-)-methyltransferase
MESKGSLGNSPSKQDRCSLLEGKVPSEPLLLPRANSRQVVGLNLPTRELADIPADWWNSASACELDLGCARGKFLVEAAAIWPERQFLGVDRQTDRVLRTRRKIRRLGLANAWAVQGEILDFLREHVPAQRISRVHVLFPDPWPKRRHASRRIFQPGFLLEVERVLLPGGALRFLTDHAPYHEDVKKWLPERSGWKIAPTALPQDQPWPETEFQARFQSRNQSVFSLELVWSGDQR